MEIIQGVFSGHHGVRLESKKRRTARIYTNIWKFNDTFLNNPRIKEEVSIEI